MKYYTSDLIYEYHKKVKEKYPDLSEEELRLAVTTPFNMIRQDMEDLNLSTCRLKYFGTFVVYPGKAKKGLEMLERALEKGSVTEEEYKKIKDKLEEYVKNESHNSK